MKQFLLLFRIPDLRRKVLFVFAMLVVYRIGAAIPIPGIDLEALRQFFAGNQLFGLINVFTGGSLDNFSIVALGLGPYITATIILQLLTMIFPQLKEMMHEAGPEGRQAFNQYGRLLTVPLAALQAFGIIALLRAQGIVGDFSPGTTVTAIAIMSAGAVFLMWLGELISEKGIGNGVSLLIFAGIISGLPTAVQQGFVSAGAGQIPSLIGFAVVAIVVIAAIVFITEGQRNIPVAYAKRIRGRRIFGGATTYLPLRVNQAGVIPIIFALSVLLFPGLIANFFANSSSAVVARFAQLLANFGSPHGGGALLYGLVYFVLVVGFTYFYTAVTFDPNAIAENLQKQGGFIPGIRPGPQTAQFLQRVLQRITLVGAMFLGVIAVLPLAVQSLTGIAALTIGGTAVLIVVSVVLETMRQVESQLVMREYEVF